MAGPAAAGQGVRLGLRLTPRGQLVCESAPDAPALERDRCGVQASLDARPHVAFERAAAALHPAVLAAARYGVQVELYAIVAVAGEEAR